MLTLQASAISWELQRAADVITHPLPALSLGYGSEDVKAALEQSLKPWVISTVSCSA